MPKPLTKTDLKGLHDALRAEMRENTKDLIGHMGRGFRKVDEQFMTINTKLDAIMSGEVLITREQLQETIHKLAQELRAQGITLDETKLLPR